LYISKVDHQQKYLSQTEKNAMNTKIFALLEKNLKDAFNLPRWEEIYNSIGKNTEVDKLPWTPARYAKFKNIIEGELQLKSDFVGTVEKITKDLSERYTDRFFREIWKPRTNEYKFRGWQLIDLVNSMNPESVLDVGCGYHPFKGRINNLVGIDPYNDCADYQIDILDYKVNKNYDVILALGSLNFNSKDEVEERFAACVNLLKTGGKFIMRANDGKPHPTGPWVDIFPWSFEIVEEFAEKYNLKLNEFKKDQDRIYFFYTKL
jgi:SAM-dependent methyltransferase